MCFWNSPCRTWSKLADTNDWAVGDASGATVQSVDEVMKGFITGSKEPGIVPLEHELNNNTVQIFMDSYPLMKENGWVVQTAPEAYGLVWYQNANSNEGPVSVAMKVSEVNPSLNQSQSAAVSSTSAPAVSSGTASVTAPADSSSSTNVSHQQGNKESSAARTVGFSGVALAAAALALAL